MTVLRIDLETFSDIDIKKAGAYKYVSSPAFEILIFCYAIDDGPKIVLDLAGDMEDIPEEIIKMLTDPMVTKKAYNANFERLALGKHLGYVMPPDQWECTAVKGARHGLPGNLDQLSKSIKLPEQKDAKGKALIKYFSVPCKPTKVNGGRTRNYPHHDWDKWEEYKEYCRQDVITEHYVDDVLTQNPLTGAEQHLWAVDQQINDRGIVVDMVLVENAMHLDHLYKEELEEEMQQITGIANPNSVQQLKAWLEDRAIEVPGISKETYSFLLEQAKGDPDVRRVIELRQELAKSSVKKYGAINEAAIRHDKEGFDWRVHGLLQFYGANRTGRWAGRLVQVQNLARNDMPDLDEARQLVREGDYDTLRLIYGSVSSVLSQLIRTAFIASPGNILRICDYSAIEARVIAWLSNEKWRLEVFATHGKIYEASAAMMFNVELDTIVKGHENYKLRSQGKVAELALGYGGGENAIEAMDSKGAIPPEERKGIRDKWRQANPAIVRFWKAVGDATMNAIRTGNIIELQHGLQFFTRDGYLFIVLPSGRRLAYYGAYIEEGGSKFGGDEVRYWGINDKKQWVLVSSYGPKFVENIVQAVARDCLAVALMKLTHRGFHPVMHIHDEIVCDEPIDGYNTLELMGEIMSEPIPWAKGLLLPADGYETPYYKKED